jgi:hypothetical protein
MYRSTTAPLILEESIRQTISARIKSNTLSRFQTPNVIDLSENFDNLTNSSFFQLKPSIFKNTNQSMQESYRHTSSPDHFLDSPVVTNPSGKTPTLNNENEPKIFHRNSQCKVKTKKKEFFFYLNILF